MIRIYVFRGLRPKFRSLVVTLTKGKLVTMSEFSDFLIAQEFICAGNVAIGPSSAAPSAFAAQCGG